MKWKVMISATLICMIAISAWILCPENEIIKNIVMSIIAAYIFYFPIEFIPSLIRDYEERPAHIVAYRHLQLLLIRVDDIAITMYNAASKGTSHLEETLVLEEFYDAEFMKKYIENGDLKKLSKIRAFDGRKLTYSESLIYNWKQILEMTSALLMMPIVQGNEKLLYELNYLITESIFKTIFDMGSVVNISDISPECFYGLNQIGSNAQKNHMDNIMQLHYLANDYYKELKKYKRNDKYKGMIVEPNFFKE